MSRPTIVIIGAGIIGLSAAYELSLLDKYRLVILSEYFPTDYNGNETDDPELYKYTSLWAGAHYRPVPFENEQGRQENRLIRQTARRFKQLAKLHPETSVTFMPGVEAIEKPSEAYLKLGAGYNEKFIDDFRTVQPDSLKGFKFAAEYECWCVNPPVLLRFLYTSLVGAHARFERVKIDSLSEVIDEYKLDESFVGVVDCSGRGLNLKPGRGAYALDGFQIRGQTLLMQLDRIKQTKYYGKTFTYQTVNPDDPTETDWTFIVPRPPLADGVFILGGTKQLHSDWQIEPTEKDKKEVLARGKKYFPELFTTEDYTIKKAVVGFRPARKGGFRLTRDTLTSSQGRKLFVVRGYGAGGYGYELSFGSAARIVELIGQALASSKF